MEGLIFAILSPFLSSISTVFKAQAAHILNPFVVLSFGSMIGAALLIPILFIRKQKISFSEIRAHKKDLVLLILSRQIFGELLLTTGLSLTLAIKGIFFTKAEPYFVLIWMWILAREKVKKEYLILLTIHIFGAIILSSGGRFGISQVGDFLVLASMGFLSFSYFPATRVVSKLGAIQTNIIMLITASLVFLPFALVFSKVNVWTYSQGWAYLIIQAVIFTTVSLTFWFASLKTVKGWMVSALRALGPLVGAPFAFFFFGETLSPIQIVGENDRSYNIISNRPRTPKEYQKD